MRIIPDGELNQRISRFQQALDRAGVEAAVIVDITDLYYYSGTAQNAHLYVPVGDEPILLVKKHLERARRESSLSRIVQLSSLRKLKETLQEYGYPLPKRLGMELDVLPASDFLRYQKIFAGSQVIDISPLIRRQRAVKSAYEVEEIRQSANLHDRMYRYIPSILREGMKDYELAALLENFSRQQGHLGLIRFRGFNQELPYGHVLVGANGAVPSRYDTPLAGQGISPLMPQGVAGVEVERNMPVLVDYTGNYTGYLVDQTRMFVLGTLASKLTYAHQVAMEIETRLAEEVKPGVLCSHIYYLAVKWAAEKGLQAHFMGYGSQVSFVGHGVGLELNDLPVIAKGYDRPLEMGMVIALEPKFVFPGVGAVGVENTYVVTEKGLERISLGSGDITYVE